MGSGSVTHAAPEPSDGIDPPSVLRIARDLKPGRYPLLTVFPGLDRVPAFRRYPVRVPQRRALVRGTSVILAKGKGEWMYVAPHELPPDAGDRWKPVVTEDDCIVVGLEHLRKSPAWVLYLDILHELFHVLQRRAGRELWDERYSYVDRPTEVEAYQFALVEARRMKAPDSSLREYLRVPWVSKKDHLRLLANLGVAPS
jgi:hypothetical protein